MAVSLSAPCRPVGIGSEYSRRHLRDPRRTDAEAPVRVPDDDRVDANDLEDENPREAPNISVNRFGCVAAAGSCSGGGGCCRRQARRLAARRAGSARGCRGGREDEREAGPCSAGQRRRNAQRKLYDTVRPSPRRARPVHPVAKHCCLSRSRLRAAAAPGQRSTSNSFDAAAALPPQAPMGGQTHYRRKSGVVARRPERQRCRARAERSWWLGKRKGFVVCLS